MNIKTKGFTLIELSIALVIVGLLLGTFLSVYSVQLQSSRLTATKQKQQLIKQALINFIAVNNRLPCPAVATLSNPTILGGSINYGKEAANPGTCTDTITSGEVVTGVVPWVTLGLALENVEDGYYSMLTYQVVRAATNRTSKTISGLSGIINTHYATPVTATNAANSCVVVGTNNPCAAVVVILSHGSDGLGAYNSTGLRNELPTGDDQLENTDNDNVFIAKDSSIDDVNSFDDILLPLTASELLAPLIQSGTISTYPSLILKDVDYYRQGVAVYGINNRHPVFGYRTKNTAPDIVATSYLDPWGNAYMYTALNNYVGLSTPTTEAVFSLESAGPDGVLGAPNDADNIKHVVYAAALRNDYTAAGW